MFNKIFKRKNKVINTYKDYFNHEKPPIDKKERTHLLGGRIDREQWWNKERKVETFRLSTIEVILIILSSILIIYLIMAFSGLVPMF